MTEEQNLLLTRVSERAPMGRMLARFWMPIARSAALEAGGAPKLVRLLGERYVAFRGDDGAVGMLDEYCPHRRASLLLAQNHGNALTCIYHGWQMGMDGRVIDIPTEADPARCAALKARIPTRHYPVHEAGGLVWAFVGTGEAPAPPAFEFTTLPADHVDIRGVVTRANWLQTMEAVLDTAHLGFLHRSALEKVASAPGMRSAGAVLLHLAPSLQVQRTPYGLREAALRTLPDGTVNTRIREFIAPFHVLVPGEPGAERQHIITVPLDDVTTIQYLVTYNPWKALTPAVLDLVWLGAGPDPDDIGGHLPGADALWGQDRAALQAGHSSGLTDRHGLCEDIATVESMGALLDRTKEFLTAIDLTVATVRREFLASLAAVERGEPAWGEVDADTDFRRLRSQIAMLPADRDWRELETFAA